MDRNSYGPGLICYGSGYSLSYPPCSVCAELISLRPVNLIYSLYKSEISFLYQIEEQHSSSHIFFRYADYKSQIRFTKLLFCIFISLFHPLGKIYFFLCSQKRNFPYFLQIHPYRVVHCYILGNSCFKINFLGIRIFRYYRFYFRIIHFLIVYFHKLNIIRLILKGHLYPLTYKRIIYLVHLILIDINISQTVGYLRIGQNLFPFSRSPVSQLFYHTLFSFFIENAHFLIDLVFIFRHLKSVFFFHIAVSAPFYSFNSFCISISCCVSSSISFSFSFSSAMESLIKMLSSLSFSLFFLISLIQSSNILSSLP